MALLWTASEKCYYYLLSMKWNTPHISPTITACTKAVIMEGHEIASNPLKTYLLLLLSSTSRWKIPRMLEGKH